MCGSQGLFLESTKYHIKINSVHIILIIFNGFDCCCFWQPVFILLLYNILISVIASISRSLKNNIYFLYRINRDRNINMAFEMLQHPMTTIWKMREEFQREGRILFSFFAMQCFL